jgi:multidrug transporter EmrE-like cation transporter
MPVSALALVLLAALMHATWNIAAKKAGGDHRFSFIASALVVSLWLPLALVSGLLDIGQWSARLWLCMVASAVLHLVYFNVLLHGYRVADLTVVYPVARGSAPRVTVAGAVLWLGESLSAAGVAGVLAVCGGVFVLAGGPGLLHGLMSGSGGQGGRPSPRVLAGLRWGTVCGLFIAGSIR